VLAKENQAGANGEFSERMSQVASTILKTPSSPQIILKRTCAFWISTRNSLHERKRPMWYALALLVHILGAIALFVAVSLIVVAFVRMRQASTLEQVREWAEVANVAGKSEIFLALIILAPALYMVSLAWGLTTPWVMASLIIFVVLSIMGATLNGRTIERVVALTRAAEPGPVPDKVHTQLLAPSLWLAEAIRLALLLGILYPWRVRRWTISHQQSRPCRHPARCDRAN
jgi:uncharacterized membrane protein YhaH (DUF805 family)